MSPKIIPGALVVSLILNIFAFAWLIQLNSRTEDSTQAIAVLQGELIESKQSAEEARTIAANLQSQVENTGTLTRFAISAISEQLAQLVTQTITLTVPVNENVPVATSVRIDQSFEVPIQTTVPINTAVTVPLRLGILGEHAIDIPIDLSIPIDLVVTVPFSEEIPINTTVPIVMDIPVTLSLKDTPLATQLAEWRATLGQLGVNGEESVEP